MTTVRSVLQECGRASQRQRDLPAHVVVYYVIALALYMQSSYREVLRCLLEGVQWLIDPSVSIRVAGKSGISQAPRLGDDATVARGGCCADRGSTNPRRLVSRLASGQSRRQHAGGRRRADERGGVRSPRGQPRRQRLPTDPLRLAGRERHACAVREPDGRLWDKRNRSRPFGARGFAKRHAVSGGSPVLQLRDVGRGARKRCGSPLADQEERASAARNGVRRRLLPEPHLPVRARPPAQAGRRDGARCRRSSRRAPSRSTVW